MEAKRENVFRQKAVLMSEEQMHRAIKRMTHIHIRRWRRKERW